MPTSSQSRILSAVDYQTIHQKVIRHEPTIVSAIDRKPASALKRHQTIDERRLLSRSKDESQWVLSSDNVRRQNSGNWTSRVLHRADPLHMPVININAMVFNKHRSFQHHGHIVHDERVKSAPRTEQRRPSPTPTQPIDPDVSQVDFAQPEVLDEEAATKDEQRSGLLNENARRLLILGTIRPSKTFYKDLGETDIQHLMKYFHRMRNTNRQVTSEEINQAWKAELVEYKPKIFFDSAFVTKTQVDNVEKLLAQYADQIRSQQAILAKLDDPTRFVIKKTADDTILATIPREYHDCLLTLVTRSDPLYRSNLITELVSEKFLADIKASSMDISYFPGGVNYDVPRNEIDEQGRMALDVYRKLKKRLRSHKVWYFHDRPSKKPNALLVVLPSDCPLHVDHQSLLDTLYDRLGVIFPDQRSDVKQRIVSMEFVPLTCILDSYDVSNQFIIDCDTSETKQRLLGTPLTLARRKVSIVLELQSYDDSMQREYEKYIKAEKYRELIKSHEDAVQRASSAKT